MRGEKLFLQNCAGCHANSTNLKVQALESSGHPKVVGVKSLSDKLDSKQVRSLVSYLEAYKSQSTAQ
jgi:mono/diheme cytochrome c family protein